MLLWSMYVDNCTLIEPSDAATAAQTLINDLFNTLGCPLADKKRLLMAYEGDFLGVVHNLEEVAVSGVTTFTPRAALLKKATEMFSGFLRENKCTPAQASKFRGLQGFLNLSLF